MLQKDQRDIQKDKETINRLLIAHSLLSTARERGKRMYMKDIHNKH